MTTRKVATITALTAATCAAALAWPSAAFAATDTTPPTVPQRLVATGTTAGSVSLAWSASTDRSGAVRYRVYVDDAVRATVTRTDHTQTDLSSDTTYTFVVRAEDRYGNRSGPSNPVVVSTARLADPPSAPSGLQVTGTTYDTISLAWQPASGPVAYYQILRNGWWVDSAYGTTATVRSLAAGTTYTLEVRAHDGAGNQSPATGVTAATRADTAPPTVPANLRVVTGASGTPTGLTWDASTDDRGVGGYWLFANGDIAFGGGQGVDYLNLTDIDCTLFHGETYTFTVRAVDLSGRLSDAGTPLTTTVP